MSKLTDAVYNTKTFRITSREIAEITEKRHDNVMRKIESLCKKNAFRSTPQFEEFGFINGLGNEVRITIAVFEGEDGFRDANMLTASISPEHCNALVDRWVELERERMQVIVELAAWGELVDNTWLNPSQFCKQGIGWKDFMRWAEKEGLVVKVDNHYEGAPQYEGTVVQTKRWKDNVWVRFHYPSLCKMFK